MNPTRWAALAALALACRSEPGAPAAAPNPAAARAPEAAPDWKAAFRHEVRWDGPRGAIVVDVDVADGFHAYTRGETVGRPLRLELAEESDVVVDGEVRYPRGVTKDLPIGRSVIVEGRTEVVAPVRLRPGLEPDEATAVGGFAYQVCTDTACDRPRMAAFRLAVPGAPPS